MRQRRASDDFPDRSIYALVELLLLPAMSLSRSRPTRGQGDGFAPGQ
jgi:hypothetical protein